MTGRQQNQIYQLRIRGLGYKTIGKALDLPAENVRYYCKTHGLAGYASELENLHKQELYKEYPTKCKNCGAQLMRNRYSGRKLFCCEKCRRNWWSNHKNEVQMNGDLIFKHYCIYCGKYFTTYGSNSKSRKYCSHECYIKNRFGEGKYRKESRMSINSCKEWKMKRIE